MKNKKRTKVETVGDKASKLLRKEGIREFLIIVSKNGCAYSVLEYNENLSDERIKKRLEAAYNAAEPEM